MALLATRSMGMFALALYLIVVRIRRSCSPCHTTAGYGGAGACCGGLDPARTLNADSSIATRQRRTRHCWISR